MSSWTEVAKRGDVSRALEPSINKLVLQLAGGAARAEAELPASGELGVTARYVYVQYKRDRKSRPATFHVEVLRRRTQESARLSFSSTFGMRQCGLGLVASRNQPVISEKLRFRLEIVEAMRVRTHRSGKAIRAHVLQHIGEDIRVAVEE